MEQRNCIWERTRGLNAQGKREGTTENLVGRAAMEW